MGWIVQGLNPGGGEIFHTHPDWPGGPPSHVYNWYRIFSQGWSGRDKALTSHSYLLLRLKEEYFCTSTPPLRLQGLFYGELYLCIVWRISKCCLAWILLLFVKCVHTWYVLTFSVSFQLGKGIEFIFERVGKAPIGVDCAILINLLNPTGHVMHQRFNIQQLYALPTLYLCVLYLSENKQRLVPLTA